MWTLTQGRSARKTAYQLQQPAQNNAQHMQRGKSSTMDYRILQKGGEQGVDSSLQLFTAERTLSDLTSTLNCILSCSLYMSHPQSFSLSQRALAFQLREWMNFLFQMPFHRSVKRRCTFHRSQFAAMRECETKHISQQCCWTLWNS